MQFLFVIDAIVISFFSCYENMSKIQGGSVLIFELELISFCEARWYDAFWFQKVMLDVLVGTRRLQSLGYLRSEN